MSNIVALASRIAKHEQGEGKGVSIGDIRAVLRVIVELEAADALAGDVKSSPLQIINDQSSRKLEELRKKGRQVDRDE